MAAEVQVPDWIQIVNTIYFVLFSGAVGFGAFTTSRRAIRYWRRNEKPPLLLIRDVIARLSLAIPFGAILFVRLVGVLGGDLRGLSQNPWWVIPTGGIAVLGALIYDLFELRIERNDRIRQLEWEMEQLRKGERI